MNAPATILIVDDNPTNLKLAADVLECEGHTIARARDADEAQEVLKHTPPNLILMDLQMPGMDGLTLTRLLKANPSYQHIPIVALTALAMKGDEDKKGAHNQKVDRPTDLPVAGQARIPFEAAGQGG